LACKGMNKQKIRLVIAVSILVFTEGVYLLPGWC